MYFHITSYFLMSYSAIIWIFLLDLFKSQLLPMIIMLFEFIVFHSIIVWLWFNYSIRTKKCAAIKKIRHFSNFHQGCANSCEKKSLFTYEKLKSRHQGDFCFRGILFTEKMPMVIIGEFLSGSKGKPMFSTHCFVPRVPHKLLPPPP
jgi:hypothetical protein